MPHYTPLTCVWEVTMGCNMRCKHCGSSCTDPLPGELTTEEAFNLIDQMASLGLKWVTLSGGEPLTRADWPQLVERLRSRGMIPNLISNGWAIDDRAIESMRASGIGTLALSVDGPPLVHDHIRKKGSFERLESAFSRMKAAGITSGAITTVTKENLHLLPELKEELIRMSVNSWQLQIGLPMGNLARRPDWLIEPEQTNELLDFCFDTSMEGRITVFPADCIGYYSHKEQAIKRRSFRMTGDGLWDGCNAGVRSFGVLHNGDILGCTSIRDKSYVEGNVRQTNLASIWNGESSFAWRRNLKKQDLGGDCGICKYGQKCLGGCPNTRLTMHGSILGENDYCVYNVALKKNRAFTACSSDPEALFSEALSDAGQREFQSAGIKLDRLLELDGRHLEALRLKGFVDFMLGNYEQCLDSNSKALEIKPGDAYARKGLGLALVRCGKAQEGIKQMEEVVAESGYRDADALHDLLHVYRETGMHEQFRGLQQRAEQALR